MQTVADNLNIKECSEYNFSSLQNSQQILNEVATEPQISQPQYNYFDYSNSEYIELREIEYMIF